MSTFLIVWIVNTIISDPVADLRGFMKPVFFGLIKTSLKKKKNFRQWYWPSFYYLAIFTKIKFFSDKRPYLESFSPEFIHLQHFVLIKIIVNSSSPFHNISYCVPFSRTGLHWSWRSSPFKSLCHTGCQSLTILTNLQSRIFTIITTLDHFLSVYIYTFVLSLTRATYSLHLFNTLVHVWPGTPKLHILSVSTLGRS